MTAYTRPRQIEVDQLRAGDQIAFPVDRPTDPFYGAAAFAAIEAGQVTWRTVTSETIPDFDMYAIGADRVPRLNDGRFNVSPIVEFADELTGPITNLYIAREIVIREQFDA